MPALTCLLVLGCSLCQSPNRLTSELPNGIFVSVQRMPGAKRLTSRLLIASRGAEETTETQGSRHLLEHLWAKGQDGQLDARLEAKGMVLSAQTLRDATEFSISGPKSSLSDQLRALRSLLAPYRFDPREVEREARIVGEEILLEPDSRKMSRAAWQAVYGAQGLDPNGAASALVSANAGALAELQKGLIRSHQMVVALTGPIDVESASNALASTFSDIPDAAPTPWQVRDAPMRGARVDSPTFAGTGLAVGVPSMSEPRTVWVLAAALARASQIEEAFVTYTPTIRNGLVLLGSSRTFVMGQFLGGPKPALSLGKDLARRWLKLRLAETEQGLFWRSYCLVQAPGANLETMLNNLEDMDASDFEKGLASFQPDVACFVSGTATFQPRAPGAPLRRADMRSTQELPQTPQLEVHQDPLAENLTVQALVPLAGLGLPDLATATVLARCLLLGNGAYSETRMREFGSQTGQPPVVEVLPSHIRVKLVFPPGNLATAVALLGSMLQKPDFGPENLAKAKALRTPELEPWRRALNPEVLDLDGVAAKDVELLYQAAFRPERVKVAFSGQVDALDARRRWELKSGSWTVEGPQSLSPLESKGRTLAKDSGMGVATFELRGPEFPYWDGAMATRLVLAAAFGLGKSGAAYRVIREINAWSYRQEAFLSPTAFGFQMRLAGASSQLHFEDEVKLREALRADVMRWNDATLATSLALLNATYVEGSWTIPIYLTPDGPVGTASEERDFEDLFWKTMTGQAFDWSKTLARARLVRLEDLKEAAIEFIDKANWVYVPARKN